MGHFSDFLAIFQYNFGDSWDIHGMRHIILGYFFADSMDMFRAFLHKIDEKCCSQLKKTHYYDNAMVISIITQTPFLGPKKK